MYLDNLILIFISNFFITYFADLFLIIKNKLYKYIYIILFECIIFLFFLEDMNIYINSIITLIYFLLSYQGHIFKRFYIGLIALIPTQICLNIAGNIIVILQNNYISISSNYFFIIIYILYILILTFNYLVFKYLQNDYRFSTFKDLFWFLTTCLLINISTYMITNYPIAEINLANIYSLILTLLMTNIFVLFTILTRRLNKNREETLQIQMRNYSSSFNKTIKKNIEESYKNNRKLKHDLHNHLLAIEMRLKNGSKDDVLDYIHQISEHITNTMVIQTDNNTLDYIINSKIITIEELKTDFQYKIEDSLSFIETYDLVIIIGNLLDNAIEAQKHVQDKRKIFFQILIQNKYTIIKIANTYNKDKIKVIDKQLISHKTDKIHHGLGLENVREVVYKYQGEYNIDIQENQFITYIKFKN